jgi:hypothetical protein
MEPADTTVETTREAGAGSMSPASSGSARATVFCKFVGFYWYAQVTLDGLGFFESKNKIHGSARQASDEVLAQIRATHASATMRRISPKQYEITVPNNAVRGAAEPRTLDGLVGSSEVPK